MREIHTVDLSPTTLALNNFPNLISLNLSTFCKGLLISPLNANAFPHLRELGIHRASYDDLKEWFPSFILAHPQIENLVIAAKGSVELCSPLDQHNLLPNLKRLATDNLQVLDSLISPSLPGSQQRPLIAVSFMTAGDFSKSVKRLHLLPSTVRDCSLVDPRGDVLWKDSIEAAAARCPSLRRLQIPFSYTTLNLMAMLEYDLVSRRV